MTRRSQPTARPTVIRLGWRSRTAITLVSVVGLAAFLWPMIASPGSQIVAHAADAPMVFAVLVPLLLAVTASLISENSLDAKAIALMGMLAAVAAALRAVGAGIAGLEPIWIVIVLGGYALGAGFGFLLGGVALMASALITGGIGPWLPFQVLGAAWVGLGAGMLSGRLPRGRWELAILAGYGAIAAVLYGWLLNLWFWPTLGTLPEPMAFVAGAGPATNAVHWLRFNLATSLGYDLPRAVLTATMVLLLGRRVLAALRRASRRAAFAQPATFLAGARPELAGDQPDPGSAAGEQPAAAGNHPGGR